MKNPDVNGKSFSVRLRQLNNDHVENLLSLSESVGWDYDRREITSIMESGSFFGHIDHSGNLVSSAAVMVYGPELASIGMVIVSPEFRRMGLGSEVMKKCLSVSRQVKCRMLVSTEEGQYLYRSIGFRKAGSIVKVISPRRSRSNANVPAWLKISKLSYSSLPEIGRFDAKAFGVGRERFLTMRLGQAAEAYEARSHGGELLGYAMSIGGSINLLAGPVAAVSDEVALTLLEKLIEKHHGPVRIDVPSEHAAWVNSLQHLGFDVVSTPEIMTCCDEELPQRNGMLYTLSAQVFG